MLGLSLGAAATDTKCARTWEWLVERDGFEPEVSLAVSPTAQSETPVPPKSAREFGPGAGNAFAMRCPRRRSLSALLNAPPRSGQRRSSPTQSSRHNHVKS